MIVRLLMIPASVFMAVYELVFRKRVEREWAEEVAYLNEIYGAGWTDGTD